MYNPYFTGTPRPHLGPPRSPTPDRQELIRKIKGRVVPQEDVGEPTPDMPHATLPRPSQVLGPSSTKPPSATDSDWPDVGLSIARPGSALHSGDFHAESSTLQQYNGRVESATRLHSTPLATSPVVPWYDAFSGGLRPDLSDRHAYPSYTARRSTVSYSPSATFSFQAPTSPLVQQSNAADMSDNDDLQMPLPAIPATEPVKRYASSPWPYGDASRSALPESYGKRSPIIRDTSIPYKAHQPRLSIGSADYDPAKAVFGRSRRTSSGARSSMVGSFEESILLGRMSSSPSVPLDFTAQIGVLGLGECKSSLKCPPHITVPFPAVFYSYGSTSAKSQPSPYVGMVDLHNRTVFEQAKRKSRTTQAPPGAYRLPPIGQLQVVVKNPHKTAVKLFLVPYDVASMQPGQKTFIRQRSVLSEGPAVDMPFSALQTTSMDAVMPKQAGRTVMRYMIQLHICCTSKDRFYLYKNVRIVFANRVPDSKEQLRNDIQYPEPRYSPYRPVDPAPDLLDEHISKRRRSEVLPSRTRDALRLSTRQTVGDGPGSQPTDAGVFESSVSEPPWLTFEKRNVSHNGDDPEDPDIACLPVSPKSGPESLLVKRLRDMEMRGLRIAE